MNIDEFARTLNLSTGTVSRALNDRPEVSARTRRLVLDKARELGFTRNPNARRLATGRNALIRLECPYQPNILSDRYLVEMARAVEEAADEHGYDLLLHLGTRHRDGEAQAVDGLVVVAAPETTAADLSRLTGNGRCPAAVIVEAEPLDFPHASYVCLDTVTGVREALHCLAALGHRRVGYIGSVWSSRHQRPALPGLIAGAGLTWDPALAVEAGVAQEDGFRAALRLLALPDPPTALFARTDVLASGALQAARHRGLGVPRDLSVIGHDDIEVAAVADPPLTTVAINIPHTAAVAVAALVAQVERKGPPTTHLLHTRLVVRRSCGPVPEPSP